jgi:hypothetical protein
MLRFKRVVGRCRKGASSQSGYSDYLNDGSSYYWIYFDKARGLMVSNLMFTL